MCAAGDRAPKLWAYLHFWMTCYLGKAWQEGPKVTVIFPCAWNEPVDIPIREAQVGCIIHNKTLTFHPCRLLRDSRVICTDTCILCLFRTIHIWFSDKAWHSSNPKPPFRGLALLKWKFICVVFSPCLGKVCVFAVEGVLFLCDISMNIKFPKLLQFIY